LMMIEGKRSDMKGRTKEISKNLWWTFSTYIQHTIFLLTSINYVLWWCLCWVQHSIAHETSEFWVMFKIIIVIIILNRNLN
jgi:hypothetical protein